MNYKKKPFPFNCILALPILLFMDAVVYMFMRSSQDTTNSSMILPVMAFFNIAFVVIATISIKQHFQILELMREDKYIICTDFESHIETEYSNDSDGHSSAHRYSVTYGKITGNDGKLRILKSQHFAVNKNPFEDGRTEIKVFIDIDNPRSPYYMYPYSDYEK